VTSTSVEIGSEIGTAAPAVPRLGSVVKFLVGLAGWTATLAALVAAIGLGVLPHLGVYRTLTVLSASMKPTFSPGDVVVVRPEPIQRLRVGQVISYAVPVGAHQVETHRVVAILRGQGTTTPVIQTKGDNNTVADPWTAQLNGSTVWRLEAVVPKAGYAVNLMRGRTFHLFSVILIPGLLAIAFLARLWGIGSRHERKPGDVEA
jgi:signal peptidase I